MTSCDLDGQNMTLNDPESSYVEQTEQCDFKHCFFDEKTIFKGQRLILGPQDRSLRFTHRFLEMFKRLTSIFG